MLWLAGLLSMLAVGAATIGSGGELAGGGLSADTDPDSDDSADSATDPVPMDDEPAILSGTSGDDLLGGGAADDQING